MKIVIVCDILGVPNNGTSIASYNLINHLKEKGHQVEVICPDEDKKGQEGFHVLETLSLGIFNNYVKKNGVVIAKRDKKLLDRVLKDADIVHIMLPFLVGHAAAKYCHKHNIPLTTGFHVQAENVMSHFFLMHVALANRITYKFMWNSIHKYASAIHFPTQFICDYVKRYGIVPPKSYVISNGVDKMFTAKKVEKPEQYKDKCVIMMSGRYSKEKNQKLLLKAIRKSKYQDKIQLILAGGGPRFKSLEKYSKKHLINQPCFKLFKREELPDVINYCDLYVHTSSVEIEAISCLEAISCGVVPCISDSKKSATSKFALVKQSHFKNDNAKDLANKIDWWIEHKDFLKEMSPKYSEFAKQFSFESCMEKMEQMLLEVIKDYEQKKNQPNI